MNTRRFLFHALLGAALVSPAVSRAQGSDVPAPAAPLPAATPPDAPPSTQPSAPPSAPVNAPSEATPPRAVLPDAAPGATATEPAPAAPASAPSVKVTPLGYVEGHYAYNFNRPSNGITNVRGFDNRHNTFSLSNVALGAGFEGAGLVAKLILQVGSTGSTYYLGEPSLTGSGGANASSGELWKYVQEAHIGWKAPVGRGLLVELGLFPSPIGIEVIPVKDNWNWSRSNLFFGLPFYHTGLRATYEWSERLSSSVWLVNGWNNVVDNNEEKSVILTTAYKVADLVNVQALYAGGIERSTGSAEGPQWRHHFDLLGQLDVTKWLSFAAQGDYGLERTRMGDARWIAGAAYARIKPVDRVYVALRGDRFHEDLATDGTGRVSAPIFWGGVSWVSSGTATVDVRPHDQLSVRLELRHDVADTPLYFGRNVTTDATTRAFVPNARTQDTLLLGATAWF